MTSETVSPQPARMIDDMGLKGMGHKAQKSHIRSNTLLDF